MTDHESKSENCLGVGISFNHAIKEEILQSADLIDFLEIVPEKYFFNRQLLQELEELSKQFTVIPHGIGLSVGSPSLDRKHLERIEEVCAITGCPYYSEHLCICKSAGVDFGSFCPIPFNDQSLRTVVKNVHTIQNQLKLPFVLENITYEFELPDQTMSEEEFFRRLVEETGCGILLDVTNVYINATNHTAMDRYSVIDRWPQGAVSQFHIAGGDLSEDGRLIDSHNQPVALESWELLEYCVKEKGIRKGVLLEHEDNFPDDFSQLLNQLEIARMILSGQDWRLKFKAFSNSHSSTH
jgi:uncharacterized protein (UPF0276 family)